MIDRKQIVMTLTHAAEVAGRAKNDLDGLRRAAEAAVEELYESYAEDDGPDDIMDFFFHVFSWEGEHNFIMMPSKDKACMVVDVCVMEQIDSPAMRNLPEGHPMHGKKIMMPRPFSYGDPDEIETRSLEDDDDE